MTYPLTPRADRLRVLRARRDQLDALIRRLEDAEIDLDPTAWPDCGTENSYKRHRRNGETPCEDCKQAHRDYVRSATPPERRKRRPSEIPPCATESAYQRHRRRGEDCDACRVAHAEHNRRREAS